MNSVLAVRKTRRHWWFRLRMFSAVAIPSVPSINMSIKTIEKLFFKCLKKRTAAGKAEDFHRVSGRCAKVFAELRCLCAAFPFIVHDSYPQNKYHLISYGNSVKLYHGIWNYATKNVLCFNVSLLIP
jgi:hypothetical protein